MYKKLMFSFGVDFYYWDYILTLYRLTFLIELKDRLTHNTSFGRRI